MKKKRNNNSPKFEFFISGIIPYIIIAILTFVVYFQVLDFGLIGFDDLRIVEKAKEIKGLKGINLGISSDPYFTTVCTGHFFRPIQNISILADVSFGNNSILIMHLTNIIIHLFTCFTILNLLILFGFDRLLSLILTSIFALHPLHSFTIVWIAARGDLLVAFFTLISFIFFIKFLRTRKIIYLILNFICFAFALFSKEIAIIAPFVYAGYYFLVNKNQKETKEIITIGIKKILTISAIWAVIAASFFIIRHILLGNNFGTYSFGFLEFVSNLRYYAEFIFKFFIPIGISGMSQFHFFTSFIGIIIIFIILTLIFKYRKQNFLSHIFALLLFIAFILPLIAYKQTFVPSLEYWEHRAYLPSFGIILILANLLTILKPKTKILIISGVLIIVFLITLTINYSKNYSNTFNFYNNIIEQKCELSNAYFARGTTKKEQGDLNSSLADLNRAIALEPNYFDALFKRAIVYKKMGNLQAAIADFKRASELNSDFIVFYNLGICYLNMNDFENAEKCIRSDIELNPSDDKGKEVLDYLLKRKQ